MMSTEEQIKSNGQGIMKFISVLSIDLPLLDLKRLPVGSHMNIKLCVLIVNVCGL